MISLMRDPEDLASAIKKLRDGRPQKDIAEKAGFDSSTWSVYEKGKRYELTIEYYDNGGAAVFRFGCGPTPPPFSESELAELIRESTFPHQKAKTLRALAERTLTEFDGVLPCDAEVLQRFSGVGPKCAHLALGVACGKAQISVDIHVHRIVNRWGYVAAATPEKTMRALMVVLPKRDWIRLNALLVPFGKHICTGAAPHCATCPVRADCQQRGVTHRASTPARQAPPR